MKKRAPPPSFVYFMYCAGRIKIGFSADARLRHQGQCTALPLRVTLLFTKPGGRKDERELHQRFAADRLHGEWFSFSPAIRAFVEEHLSGTVGGHALLARAEQEFLAWLKAEMSRLTAPSPFSPHVQEEAA